MTIFLSTFLLTLKSGRQLGTHATITTDRYYSIYWLLAVTNIRVSVSGRYLFALMMHIRRLLYTLCALDQWLPMKRFSY